MNDLALSILRPLTVVVIVAALLIWLFELLGFPWKLSFKAGGSLALLYLMQYLYSLNSGPDTRIQLFISAWLFGFVYVWLSFNQQSRGMKAGNGLQLTNLIIHLTQNSQQPRHWKSFKRDVRNIIRVSLAVMISKKRDLDSRL